MGRREGEEKEGRCERFARISGFLSVFLCHLLALLTEIYH